MHADESRHISLENACLRSRDLFDRRAEKFGMIDRDRRYDRGDRIGNDIGRVEVAAEADFEEKVIGRMLAKKLERRRGGDFEKRDRPAFVDVFALRQGRGQFGVVDEATAPLGAKSDPLMKANKMRRRIDVDLFSRRFQDGAHEGDRRSFAVRAGNMNGARQSELRRPHAGEQVFDTAKGEIDSFRMQRQKTRQYQIPRIEMLGHRHLFYCRSEEPAVLLQQIAFVRAMCRKGTPKSFGFKA